VEGDEIENNKLNLGWRIESFVMMDGITKRGATEFDSHGSLSTPEP
jgi:hypothetical protein